MLLHLPFDLTESDDIAPAAASDPAGLDVEMALQMKLNAKLSFQGVFFDGVTASVNLARVTRLPDILASHKTNVGSAFYSLPAYREAFVAHMVQLVSCSSFTPFSPVTLLWPPAAN